MTIFDDILKSANFNPNLTAQIGLSTQISAMLKANKDITNNFSGYNMMAEITKSLSRQEKYAQFTFIAANSISKTLDWKSKFVVPNATIVSISSINRQYEQLFGNFRNIIENLKVHQSAFSQMNNWQFALNGISGQLAAVAASQHKWDLLEDFESITEEAVAINERILDNDGITKQGLEEIKSFLERIEIRVDKIDKDANSIFWKLLALLCFFLALSGEIRNWQAKPEYATRLEVESVIKAQFSLIEVKLKEGKEHRKANRDCKVMLKPMNKSKIIEILPKNFEIVVLQVHHKWIYVSYFSPSNNLPQTGWIMKKYLANP